MNIKTYTEDDSFPSNCWFADWQPSGLTPNPEYGDILLRRRDDCATTALITIPVGSRGLTRKKAERVAELLLAELKTETDTLTPYQKVIGAFKNRIA